MQSIVKMRWLLFAGTAAALLVAALLIFRTSNVSAHEGREAGDDYEIHFGWQVEPAYAGVYNGPELFVHQKGASEEDETPVEGAEKTLKLKVTFGSQSKELKLEPVVDDPGHYVASLTPTRPGDYSFQLTGMISTTDAISPTVVNETFTSSDGEFSSIEPAGDVLFPDNKVDMVSLQSQVDALKTQVDALKKELDALKAVKK